MTSLIAPARPIPGVTTASGRPVVRLAGAGAAALALSGVLQLSHLHWIENKVRTGPQHLTMALFVVGVLATLPLLVAIGRRAGRAGRITATACACGQVLICAITTLSNIRGADVSWFNAAAGLGMLLWLPGVVGTAVVAAHRRVLPRLAAVALLATYVGSIPLATSGGGLIAALSWTALTVIVARRALPGTIGGTTARGRRGTGR